MTCVLDAGLQKERGRREESMDAMTSSCMLMSVTKLQCMHYIMKSVESSEVDEKQWNVTIVFLIPCFLLANAEFRRLEPGCPFYGIETTEKNKTDVADHGANVLLFALPLMDRMKWTMSISLSPLHRMKNTLVSLQRKKRWSRSIQSVALSIDPSRYWAFSRDEIVPFQ